MKVRKLFKPTAISQSIGGFTIFLDRDNCEIVNKTKNKNFIMLHLKRKSDGEEGQTHLKVQDQFKTISIQLLNWAFVSKDIIGLTLNQLDDLETNLNIEKVQGRL
ncbi:hypothetical protein HYR65_03550 [Candidatus Azambacteria bacterium]|nr:hypothetical protein [Candidatus Azambacteria bacterium]